MTSDQPTHEEVTRATAETEAGMCPQPVPVNVYETPAALVASLPWRR